MTIRTIYRLHFSGQIEFITSSNKPFGRTLVTVWTVVVGTITTDKEH